MHQQDRVGAPVADVAAGGQLDLLFGGEALPAVGADKQPCGALALGGPVGVVGERRDAVQRGVDPECGADHPDNGEHEDREQGEHDATQGGAWVSGRPAVAEAAVLGAQPDSVAAAVAADIGAMTVGTAQGQAGEAAEDASAESRDWAARPVAVGSGRA